MASWRDRIGPPATFRGVPFFIEKAEASFGRATVTHKYPFRDDPFVEDLGRRPREFSIDGYVVGDDYLAKRDALLAAAEQAGPGTLVHPYYGTLTVAVTGDVHVEESVQEAGIARITIVFTQTPSSPAMPTIGQSPSDQVAASADAALAAKSNHFLDVYTPAFIPTTVGTTGRSLPTFAFTSVASLVQSAGSALQAALAPAIKDESALASFKRAIDQLAFDATDLVRTPTSLASRFADLFKQLLTAPATPRLGLSGLLQAFNFTSSATRPVATTTTTTLEQANYDATDSFIRSQIAIQATRFAAQAADITTGAADGGYDSYEDALALRDELLDQLDAQAELADDPTYAAIQQLRADVIAAVPGDTRQLPHLVTYVPPVTVPSLVLAHQLYGAIDMESDLLTRNDVRYPGFILGGRALQVLADA